MGTVGDVGQIPWKGRPANGLQQGLIPIWLDLSRAHGPPMRGTTLAPLVTGRLLRDVKGLDLRGQSVGVEGAKAIAASQSLYGLQVLLLSNTQLDETSVRALAYAHHLNGLLVVDLSNNPGSSLGTSELAGATWLPALEQLDLRNTPAPTPEAARKLGQRLAAIVQLRISADWPADVQDALREGLGSRVPALVVE